MNIQALKNKNVKIGYLDDQLKYRESLKDYFLRLDIEIDTFQSVEEVIKKLDKTDNIQWILISDLVLDGLSGPFISGDSFLEFILSKYSNVFAVILTAYPRNISIIQEAILESNSIKVYAKQTDNEVFLLNLIRDFEVFLTKKKEYNIPQKRIFNEIKRHTLFYLQSIERKDSVINLPSQNKSFHPIQLIDELQKNEESELAIQAMENYLNIHSLINSIKQKNAT